MWNFEHIFDSDSAKILPLVSKQASKPNYNAMETSRLNTKGWQVLVEADKIGNHYSLVSVSLVGLV